MATTRGPRALSPPDPPPEDLVGLARRVHRILGREYPDARCELEYGNPFELLVATVLSAQCTDERVNSVTPRLFEKYPDAEALAGAPRATVEEIIRPTGFFRAKTESLLGLSRGIVEDHGGKVPNRLEDLVSLKGVGRKTANVVLGNAFDVPGLPVDTHVGRLARRLGLTEETDPVAVERDLTLLIRKQDWTSFSHRLIFHGRRCCTARKPACERCPLNSFCPSSVL